MSTKFQLSQFLVIITLFNIYLGVFGAGDCKYRSNGSRTSKPITVGTSGSEKFKSIQDAIDSIPSNNDQWIKIEISPGIYKYDLESPCFINRQIPFIVHSTVNNSCEKVTVPADKPCIFLEGARGRNFTTISFDSHKGDLSARSTFSLLADNFVAKGITFQNSYNLGQKIGDPRITQALAARVSGDKSVFIECGFMGVQDTLWDEHGRHYFYSCYIEGAVDFIFGNGQSFYEDCSINTDGAYITAQGRGSPTDPSGFVFRGGIIFGSGQNILGRAYGPYSRVIFLETMLTAVIDPRGWDAWHLVGQEGNFIYAEVNCGGPGSDTSKRVPWTKKLDDKELSQYSRSSFIDQDGWLDKSPISEITKSTPMPTKQSGSTDQDGLVIVGLTDTPYSQACNLANFHASLVVLNLLLSVYLLHINN